MNSFVFINTAEKQYLVKDLALLSMLVLPIEYKWCMKEAGIYYLTLGNFLETEVFIHHLYYFAYFQINTKNSVKSHVCGSYKRLIKMSFTGQSFFTVWWKSIQWECSELIVYQRFLQGAVRDAKEIGVRILPWRNKYTHKRSQVPMKRPNQW